MSDPSQPVATAAPSSPPSNDIKTEAVEMKDIAAPSSVEMSTPASPTKDATAATDADGAASLSAAAKGKQKADLQIAGKDSLSIDRTDEPASPTGNPADGPVCNITLLLPSGARHPYRIDEKYLAKRNVDVPELTEDGKTDPRSISVYKLKELILREWRDEWDGKPASPSSIRLIHFGKLLEDKEQLKSMYIPLLSHLDPLVAQRLFLAFRENHGDDLHQGQYYE
jgi:hypothetical protein